MHLVRRLAEIVVEGSRTGGGFGRLSAGCGVAVIVREGAGLIRIDDTILALTDGRTATEWTISDGSPAVLSDSLDHAAATRGVARSHDPDQADDTAPRKRPAFSRHSARRLVVDDAQA